MFQKLKEAEDKFNAIDARLQHPDIFSDMEVYSALIKEYRTLEPVILKYCEYRQTQRMIDEALELLDASPDAELRELAAEELHVSKEKLVILEEELKILLLPHDPNDEKNIMVEIRGGAGGEEAALFAAVLYRMYTMYAQRMSFKTSLLSVNETELGGFKEITFMVEGSGA